MCSELLNTGSFMLKQTGAFSCMHAWPGYSRIIFSVPGWCLPGCSGERVLERAGERALERASERALERAGELWIFSGGSCLGKKCLA